MLMVLLIRKGVLQLINLDHLWMQKLQSLARLPDLYPLPLTSLVEYYTISIGFASFLISHAWDGSLERTLYVPG